MVKKLMLAVAMMALVAAPSFAAVQNVKVSGSIKTTSVIRNDVNTTTQLLRSGSQNEILGQTGLNVSADLTDNVSTFIGLTNERLWDSTAGSSASQIRLDAAYVTMKELFYAPLTLTVGRQSLAYGNQLIIGDGDGSTDVANVSDLTGGVNFDAIKAVLAYDPLTVDVVAARVSNNSSTVASLTGTHDNINLYGVNANYKMGDKMSSVVEGYLFVKQDDSSTEFTPAYINEKSTTTYVPGLRLSTNPIEGLNVQLEGAYQMGHAYNSDPDAMLTRANSFAVQSMINYALPMLKDMKPVLSATYTYLQGNTIDSTKKGWDTMFMNQNVGKIYHAIGLDGANSQLANLGFEVSPIKDLTTKISGTGVWYANEPTGSNNSKYLGTEADLDVTYAYTEDVKFGLSAGYFMTGKAYKPGQNPVANNNASQLLSSVSVLF